jgi:hypothetical protein
MDRALMWTGDPLLYPRRSGHGLIAGKHHYLFDADGRMESMQAISRPVIQMLLPQITTNPAALLAAHLKTVSKVETPDVQ